MKLVGPMTSGIAGRHCIRAKMRKTACNEAGRNKQKVEADKKEMKKKK